MAVTKENTKCAGSKAKGSKLMKSIIHHLEQQGRLGQERNYIQHGTTTVFAHSIRVARLSLRLAKRLHLKVNDRALLRGALLHDYFLYDWHDKTQIPQRKRLHGFWHPGIALRNAEKEYKLTDRQREIIRKHMWPLSVVPPTCREAWVVTTADKYCSLMETIGLHKGHGAKAS